MEIPPNAYLEKLRADCAVFRTRGVLAPLTERCYESDWRAFSQWCAGAGLAGKPAESETLSLYIAHMLATGRKIATARRHVWAVIDRHARLGVEPPDPTDARKILHGAQRVRGERPLQKEPLTISDLERICAQCDPCVACDARDRAILAIGFASALRRSNISALNLDDVEAHGRGIVLHVRREKQDRYRRGRMIGLPRGSNAVTCPVAALDAWLSHRGRDWEGPLFTSVRRPKERLSPAWIAEVVKHRVGGLGREAARYGAHSLRAGFVTEAGERGVSELVIAAQTGHKSMEVLRRYFRRRDIWKANAAAMIGL